MNRKQLVPTAAMAAIAFTGSAGLATADENPGTERASLDLLLAEQHALSVETAIRSLDDHEAADAARKALDENTDQLDDYFTELYGEADGKRATAPLHEHNNWLDDYLQTAQEGMPGEAPDLSALSENQNAQNYAIALHSMAGHYAEGDFESAYRAHLEGFEAAENWSSDWLESLAENFPERFETHSEQADDLRLSLNRLGAEHIALSQLSMTKGFDGAADFDFAEWAQDENAESFRALFADYYGEEQGARFLELWTAGHLFAQSDLSQAAAEEDKNAQQAAAASLTADFPLAFGNFLDDLTQQHTSAEAAQQALASHEAAAVEAFAHYQQEDYEAYYSSYSEGFMAIGDFSGHFTAASAEQLPERFTAQAPDKMPATGLGGGSLSYSPAFVWLALSAAILTLGAAFASKPSRKQSM